MDMGRAFLVAVIVGLGISMAFPRESLTLRSMREPSDSQVRRLRVISTVGLLVFIVLLVRTYW